MAKKTLFLLCLVILSLCASAQSLIKVSGIIYDEKNQPLPKVSVTLVGLSGSTVSDEEGKYTIHSRLSNFSLRFKLVGYRTETIKFSEQKGTEVKKDVFLKLDVKELKGVKITGKQNQLNNAQSINVTDLASLPTVSMNFEAILKTLPGVSTNNELSSQYSVRGGNFDENLIYVNDIEINRPILIRNGQQEGLSFINPDFVSRARFSAGGFNARYNDKLSSVLDVRYDKPDSNEYVISAGLMGFSATAKSNFKNSHLLFGFRRKDNRNVLGTQDQKGSYRPNFNDFQALYQYNFSQKFSINTLLNFNSGSFKLVPQSRETQFGTITTPMRLKVDYEGQEIDDYYTYGGAVTALFNPYKDLSVKWINSYFEVQERERFDIDGNYVFEEVDNDYAGGGFGPIRKNRGLGNQYSYARNSLNSSIASTELKVEQRVGKHEITYGARFEQAKYVDKINEYSYLDSAGYILPANTNSFTFEDAIFSNNHLKINTISGYLQDSYAVSAKTDVQFGLRASYNDLSSELLFSPRLLMLYRPDEQKLWRFTAGIYRQAPSYRSIRDLDGSLNLDQKAQRSYNISAGYDFSFNGLGTRLKFTSEVYYKYADRMIPYTVDNVRIKYLATSTAKGNTYGADFSLGGELVKDLMSFFRVSILSANQDVINDSYVAKDANGQNQTIYPGYLKRPTDQKVNFSMFFQDRLFKSPTYKVHLNLLYGSRLPIGAPQIKTYTDDFSIPAYRRVDIGFSNDFLDASAKRKPKFLSKYFNSVIAYAEVFNLLNINNTVSYLWLKDVNNVNYAIPNYLTGRQLNFKLIFKIKGN
ncbi:TonB-dependent receptor [Pedobacter chitinilyticus]|uniref:TonB-dependent receptor n=1 Tax=Pedobacter chitinilyticus TaxID=2233776 RepID=A0A3S3QHA7_9SPHI|nr:carboxypeptidase-like regulatory domain-containing protein [Pedobacter chitinilyticus]RWU10154.1 TonB-dependent receptor [Pedobacter chitinilyticus]